MSRVVHFEIHCDDLDRAERFYTEVFGWRFERYGGVPVDYRLATTGPDEAPGINGALTQRNGDRGGPGMAAYVCTIGVGDIEAVERAIAASGGSEALPRMDVPGVGLLSYWLDTEGNTFGVIQPGG